MTKTKKLTTTNKELPVLSSERNIQELAKTLKTSAPNAKRLLTDTNYFKGWVETAERERVLKTYAFINRALTRLKSTMSKSAYLGLAKAMGISADKIQETRPQVLQQINLGGKTTEVIFTKWKNPPDFSKR